MMGNITIIPLRLPIVKKDDKLSQLIIKSIEKHSLIIEDNDIFVIAHTIISRIEGKEYNLSKIDPSPFAEVLARKTNKDPCLVELILRESLSVLKVKNNNIITKTKHGWICANSAVDQSNSKPGHAITLPVDSNESAKQIGQILTNNYSKNISVLISDTQGRALRRGAVNVAIGAYNFSVIDDARKRRDIFGYPLKSTIIGLADEVCAAAELVMGQADEKAPVVLIKGFKQRSCVTSIDELQYIDEKRLFR